MLTKPVNLRSKPLSKEDIAPSAAGGVWFLISFREMRKNQKNNHENPVNPV
jgi:hypothetical protein